MIRKTGGGKYKLVSKTTGKTLGTHDTPGEAAAQERAIQISKARRAGHPIPKKGR